MCIFFPGPLQCLPSVEIIRANSTFPRYKKAYDSMKACPLSFSHPSEAQQLHGFGPKLCDRLTAKLNAHCEQNGLPLPELPHQGMPIHA